MLFLFGLQMDIFDAAERYKTMDLPVIILAGHQYGCGSTRDWAAKGLVMLVSTCHYRKVSSIPCPGTKKSTHIVTNLARKAAREN